ncbi:uncharacterized protein LOC141695411 [Apium graveolens]|uniref:uncharacterized protein LOC141695411 n=1 Tax=Apium graveolens TaxID=4045 RepID=UPI003D79432C
MFPYSIKGRALKWFQQLPDTIVATWESLSTEFLSKYYPSDKTQQMRAIIMSFKTKSLGEIQVFVEKMPTLWIFRVDAFEYFYGSLSIEVRLSIDVAAGGDFKKSPVTKAEALLKQLTSNNYEWAPNGANSVKSTQDTEMMNLLTLKLDALTQEVRGQRANVNAISSPMDGYTDYSAGEYSYTPQFPEEAAFIQGRQSWPVQNNFYYNPNQRPNNNLSYSSNYVANPSYVEPRQNQPPGFQPRQQYQGQQYQPQSKEKKEPADWEVALNKMMQGTTRAFANIETKFDKVESRLDQMMSSQKMLENQIGQIANKVGVREQGSLPSQPDPNGKEHCKAITLRNGRELPEIEAIKPKEKVLSKEDEIVEAEMENSKKVYDEQKEEVALKAPIKTYLPPIPFPQRLYNRKLEKQYEKFLQIFQQLHINIPFADALAQMPLYAKFLKEMLSRKRKL